MSTLNFIEKVLGYTWGGPREGITNKNIIYVDWNPIDGSLPTYKLNRIAETVGMTGTESQHKIF